MTIPLIEMTDYSNVQKVIKNPAAVFLPFSSLSPPCFPPCREYFCLQVGAGESSLEGDVSFPSFKLMIIIRITCHMVNIQEILFFPELFAQMKGATK